MTSFILIFPNSFNFPLAFPGDASLRGGLGARIELLHLEFHPPTGSSGCQEQERENSLESDLN